MAIFKCKMCGGTLEITNQTVATCEYCGMQQTLPKLDDERKVNLYDRANHFRRNNEFDKAMGIYEQILNSDPTDAESYWSLVLCRFGIEYVEDPASHKRIPTVNRAQFTSIFDDNNYKSALEYADSYQRSLYEEEAKTINKIQKGILAISQKEEPFDVFICYKETDNNGRRTHDSVLANDLYHQLTQEGFKVFFARITLEDKLGSAYEPYIFAALNSAKVMVVLGTKPEFFNAVWVRNEWSRYLSLIKGGAQKTLIPAYRDMDPYDLPEEFSHLQAQDMSKLGFMQDLIRGIKKIAQTEEPKPAVVMAAPVVSENANVTALLDRAMLALEDAEFSRADDFCEQVLNLDARNAQAYLGKMMATFAVRQKAELKELPQPFDDNANYQKVLRFGDAALVNELKGYIAHINERNENARMEGIYQEALRSMQNNATHHENTYRSAAQKFGSIPEYKDAKALRDECLTKAEAARTDDIYNNACRKMRDAEVVVDYEETIKIFGKISYWKDSKAQIQECKNKIKFLLAKQEEERLERERNESIARAQAELAAKKKKRNTIILSVMATVLVTAVCMWNFVLVPNQKYNDAMALKEAKKYTEAITAFKKLGGYKDSAEQLYDIAVMLMNAGEYSKAYDVFVALDSYKDSMVKADFIFAKMMGLRLAKTKVGEFISFGHYEQDNYTSNGKEAIEWLILAKEDNRLLVISRYALDVKPYNEMDTNVTWETCTLRKWLNNDFMNAAFSSAEKALIPTVIVSADKNPDYSTKPGNATQDKVFLLSIPEANKYFKSGFTRRCKTTAYANKQGPYTDSSGFCWWWLRSPGIYQDFAATVLTDGDFLEMGRGVNTHGYGSGAVRPALWINLEP